MYVLVPKPFLGHCIMPSLSHPLWSLSSAPRVSKLWYNAVCSRASGAIGVKRIPKEGTIISPLRDSVADIAFPDPAAFFASPALPIRLLPPSSFSEYCNEHWSRRGVKTVGLADLSAAVSSQCVSISNLLAKVEPDRCGEPKFCCAEGGQRRRRCNN